MTRTRLPARPAARARRRRGAARLRHAGGRRARSAATPRQARASGPARVERVVDGDTLKVRLQDGRRKTVRVLGIDTPETKKPDTPIECGGPQASAAMRRLALDGRRCAGAGPCRHARAPIPARTRSTATGACSRTWMSGGRDLGQTLVGAGMGGGLRLSPAVPAAAGLPARGAAGARRRSRRLEPLRGRLSLGARLTGSGRPGYAVQCSEANGAGGRLRQRPDPLGGGGEVLEDPGDEVAGATRRRRSPRAAETAEQILLRELRHACGRRRGSAASAATSPSTQCDPQREENASTRSCAGAPGRSGSNRIAVEAAQAVAHLGPGERRQLLGRHPQDRRAQRGSGADEQRRRERRRRRSGRPRRRRRSRAGRPRAPAGSAARAAGARTCGSASRARRWSRTRAAASGPPSRSRARRRRARARRSRRARTTTAAAATGSRAPSRTPASLNSRAPTAAMKPRMSASEVRRPPSASRRSSSRLVDRGPVAHPARVSPRPGDQAGPRPLPGALSSNV